MLILMKNKLKIESMYSSEIIVLQPIGNISIALVSQIGYIFEYWIYIFVKEKYVK